MKKLFLTFILTTFVASPLFAGNVPHCWDNSTKPTLADGSYLITIDTDPITKEKLLEVMDLAKGRHLLASTYPLLMRRVNRVPGSMHIVTQGYDSGFGAHKLPREQLIKVVKKALQPIADTNHVRLSCNYIMRPMRSGRKPH